MSRATGQDMELKDDHTKDTCDYDETLFLIVCFGRRYVVVYMYLCRKHTRKTSKMTSIKIRWDS